MKAEMMAARRFPIPLFPWMIRKRPGKERGKREKESREKKKNGERKSEMKEEIKVDQLWGDQKK